MKSTVAFLRAGNLRACVQRVYPSYINARAARPPCQACSIALIKFQRQSRRQHHPAPAAVHPTPAPARSNAAPLPRSTRRAPRIVTAASPHCDRRRAIVHPVPSSRCIGIVRYAVTWHLTPAPLAGRTTRPRLHAIARPCTAPSARASTPSPAPAPSGSPPSSRRPIPCRSCTSNDHLASNASNRPHLTMPLSSSLQQPARRRRRPRLSASNVSSSPMVRIK